MFQDSAEEESSPAARITEEQSVYLPSMAHFQNAVIHQLQNISLLLNKMNQQIMNHSFTMAHYQILKKWERTSIGPSLGHEDLRLLHEASSLLGKHFHSHALPSAVPPRRTSRSSSR